MYEEDFKIRLAKLRSEKGISARNMSLSIGQNPGYINNIESGKVLPSMSNFFYICEFLNISPQDFFDTDAQQPEQIHSLVADLKKLDKQQLECIEILVKGLIRNK